jgi:hypothetical protein
MHALIPSRIKTRAVAAVLVAGLGLGGIAQAKPRQGKAATCTLKTVDAAPTAINAEDFGVLKCSGPFGAGVQHNTGKLSPTSATEGTLAGTSMLFFDDGTVRASFSISYTLDGANITYGGTAKVLGGTGAFKGITGAAKLQGSSSDGGTHGSLTEKITYSLRS